MKYWKLLFSLLFALVMFWFWAFPHVSLLCYHEQYQLFLFNTGYMVERLSLPGGLADYLSEFIVQFFYVPVYGAALLAALFLLLQWLTWIMAKERGATDARYPLSFIPAIALWFMMSDENVLLSLHVALAAVLCLCCLYSRLAARYGMAVRAAALLPTVVIAYWLFGPAVYVLMAWAAIVEMGINRSLKGAALLAAMLVVALFTILLSSRLPYELHRFFIGINYFRYPVYNPTMQFLVMTLFAFLPSLASIKPKQVSGKRLARAVVVKALIIAACGGLLIYGTFNNYKHQLIEYDFLVRAEKWDAIIEKAERVPAVSPMDVSCVNLALSQKGLLAERLFDFYQNGPEGLLPAFTRDMVSPVSTAEIYFRLGMVNDAHRYMFEAQEAIPNFRKSGRMTKRIIQCEIINGQYEVARKFLRRLSQTIFYRQWALTTMRLIDNEKAVNAHPLYGTLRSLRHHAEDYLFSDSEVDQMLGMLFTGNKRNRMAYEYLICYVLLQRNMEKFMAYYPIGQYAGYTRIPRAFQEVLVGNWLQKHPDPKTIPYKIDGAVLENTMSFIRLYMADHNSKQLDMYPYSTNAWHYLLRGGGDKTKEQAVRGAH